MTYTISITCNGEPPLEYHWVVKRDTQDQREGDYALAYASGKAISEWQAQADAEAWCDNKHSIETKKLNRHYSYSPK